MKKSLAALFILISAFILGIPLWALKDFSRLPAEAEISQPVVRVLNSKTGRIMNMSLEEYLVGVVAAEMPANFNLEALKAQAIAARTYTVRRMFNYGAKPNPDHPDAEICTEPSHCQAWCDEEELKSKWGRLKYYFYLDKIETAVKTTRGLVITYNNNLIDPVYHSSCGGRGTEDSEDVWSHEIPYLRGVDCNREYKAAEQVYAIEFDRPHLASVLRNAVPVSAAAGPEKDFLIQPVKRSPRGRLQELTVLGQKMTGPEFRQALGLTSSLITWKVTGDKVRFMSIGKGHAVGMCQYGSNGMALEGSNYREIISHYYTGVRIRKLKY